MATNSGESKIKQDLQADLLLKDGGTIQSMLGKVKQLHTEITKLSEDMQKVMGSSSGTSGFVKQLQEAASLMREMKQNAHALGQATANPTAAARNTLISGAAAAGHLQGLKDTLTAEEKLYQLRVAQGKVNINTLLKETDARKLALAQEGLLLRSQTARLSKSREIAAKQLEALKGELQLRKAKANQQIADDKRVAAEQKKAADNLAAANKGTRLHENELEASAKNRTTRAKATLKEQQEATAVQKRSAADIAKITDKVGLQQEARYSKIRQGMTLTAQERKDELAYQGLLQGRLKVLGELEAQQKKANTTPTAAQAQSAQIQHARLTLAQQTSKTVDLSQMGTHQLNALKQGQQDRYMAAEGRRIASGATSSATAKDALALLDKIKEREREIAEARKAALNSQIQPSLTAHQAAEKAYKLRVAEVAAQGLQLSGVKKLNSLAETGLQIDAAKLRMKHAIAAKQDHEAKKEDELVQKLIRHRQVLARQAEEPADRHRINEFRRQDTRDRLFGDGGANTMIVQAGLMANYQVLGGLQSLLSGAASSAIEFDKALKQVQAVSAATRNEMVDLRQSLIEVAQSSRFSAAEVAQASVLLAQAGLSVKEIQQTMAATIALATASGSELKKSVDVMTSVLSVFDMGADKSTDVANKLTAALNMSKLDIDKMALGLQYAGNAAADAGVTFDELVSTLSAMANAGIRSGSTLGTGTRQLFVELQKPSENFKRVLDRLGIGMSQIDIKAQGFEGVLRNLQEAGFTTGDAFQSFQIRAASSFAALSNNINVFHDMQDAIEGTNAAMEANEIQMESLAVQYDHLKSNLGIVAAEGFAPVLAATRDTVKMLAHFFEGAEKGSASLKVAFTALTGVVLVAASAMSLNMVAGLVKLGGGIRSLLVVTQLGTLALAKFAAGARVAGTALALLSFTPIILGLGLIATAFISFGKESEKLKNKLDEARTTLNGFVEANSKSQQTIENVDEAVNTLATRYARLSENSQELDGFVKELANQFRDQGLTIENLAGKSIEQLIETLGRLRTELSDDYVINIRKEGEAKVDALKAEADKKLGDARGMAAKLAEVPLGKLRGADMARAKTPAEKMTEEERMRGAVKDLAAIRQEDPKLAKADRAEALARYGYKEEGELNNQLAEALAAFKIPPETLKNLRNLDQILKLNQAGRGVSKQMEAVTDNSFVKERTETFTAEAMRNPDSGYGLVTRLKGELSVKNAENPKGGASLDYLRSGLKQVDDRIDTIKAIRETLKKATDPQTMAQYQALGLEETALATQKSVYAKQMEPLIKEEKLRLEDQAKYELEDAEKEVKRIEKQIKDEKNINLLTNEMADKLAAARRVLGQKRIEALVAEKTRAGDSPARIAMAEARLRAEIQSQLEDGASPYLNDAKDALIKENKDFDQKLGKDALTAPFKEIDKQLDNFDTNLKGLLDERSGGLSAKVRQLKQRIQDNRLAGAGIATSGDLYGPKALGRNNDLADLSFRRRAGAQFRSAALGKELQKAQVEEAKIKVSAIDVELPKLLALQDTHQAELEKLQGTRDASRAELDKLIAQQDQAEKDGTSLSPAFADKKKQAYEDWKVMADVYDAQEKQANTIKDKIYGLEDTKGNLLDTLGNQEGKFQLWLDALKTGVEGLTQSFSDMFQRIVTGTGDTEEAFREMGRGILASMLQVISNKITQQFMEIVGGFIGNALMPSPAGVGAGGDTVNLITPPTGPMGSIRTGGPIHRRAGGGYVPGSVARDAVPTLLMPGEFVLQKSASAALGEDFLHGLNRTTGATMRQGAERAAKAAAPAAQGEPSSVNVWVVTPDQQTGMSKDDIIVTVGDNIARNGSIRKLIKQVQVGG